MLNVTIVDVEHENIFIFDLLRFCVILSVIATIFDLQLTPTSESIYTIYFVLLDTGNLGITITISLLSSIEADT